MPEERTYISGYFAASIAAYTTFATLSLTTTGDSPSRFDLLGWLSILLLLGMVLAWIAMTGPFVLVRSIVGARGFSSAWGAGASGAVVGLLSIPTGVAVSRLLAFDGPIPSFRLDLLHTAQHKWPIYGGAGMIGGLIYWLVEFSALLGLITKLMTDTRAIPGTGQRISRRTGACAILAACVVVLFITARWWWRPHVHYAQGTPRVAFVREWATTSPVDFVAWSADRARIVTVATDEIAVHDPQGRQLWRKATHRYSLADATANGRMVVIAGGLDADDAVAFSSFDLADGRILHAEPDPAPERGGRVSGSTRLAMSADGRTLAVAYNSVRAGQALQAYDTFGWRTHWTIPMPSTTKVGPLAVAFSPDGGRIAFGVDRELKIADVRHDPVLSEIRVEPRSITFSPDGNLIAVETEGDDALHHDEIRIYELAGGALLASHVTSRTLGAGQLIWDRDARFLVLEDDAHNVRLWDWRHPDKPTTTIDIRNRGGRASLAVSNDGRCLAVGNASYVSLFEIDDDTTTPQGGHPCG